MNGWDIIGTLVYYGVIALIVIVIGAVAVRYLRQLIKWIRGEN
jgi:hypothetical protein